jgi:hypothetical protein
MELIASKLDEKSRARLLHDLNDVRVVCDSTTSECLKFEIPGYERPEYQGQHAYPVEARVQDADRTEMSLVLYADEQDRILELEFIRWDDEQVAAPLWETLRVW